jgi:hypothetical protein
MASDRRPPGSDSGRPACDWEQAFVSWAALPAERRSYAAAAAEFGVSPRTSSVTGGWSAGSSGWARSTRRRPPRPTPGLGRKKAEQIGRLRKLIEATMVSYAEKLRRGDVRISPSDLDRLHKLWRQLDGELTHTDATPRSEAAAPARPVEHAAAVVQALAESGALTRLGLQIIPPHEDDDIIDEDEGGV